MSHQCQTSWNRLIYLFHIAALRLDWNKKAFIDKNIREIKEKSESILLQFIVTVKAEKSKIEKCIC